MDARYLCRAKAKKNGKWIIGYYIHTSDGGDYIVNPDRSLQLDEGNAIDVDTLCRCTGLVDKYSTLIFENDLCCYLSCGAVGYIKNCDIVWLNSKIIENASQSLTTCCDELEVLDNIIDHPEI